MSPVRWNDWDAILAVWVDSNIAQVLARLSQRHVPRCS